MSFEVSLGSGQEPLSRYLPVGAQRVRTWYISFTPSVARLLRFEVQLSFLASTSASSAPPLFTLLHRQLGLLPTASDPRQRLQRRFPYDVLHLVAVLLMLFT